MYVPRVFSRYLGVVDLAVCTSTWRALVGHQHVLNSSGLGKILENPGNSAGLFSFLHVWEVLDSGVPFESVQGGSKL